MLQMIDKMSVELFIDNGVSLANVQIHDSVVCTSISLIWLLGHLLIFLLQPYIETNNAKQKFSSLTVICIVA